MIEANVIVMNGNKISEELASDCLASGKKFGLKITKFNAVWGDSVEKEYNNYNLKPFPGLYPFWKFWKFKSNRDTKGVRGCFLSHFILWKKCLSDNKPLIIFEHDALVIRPLDINNLLSKFDDVLNLDAFFRVAPVYEEWLKKNNGNGVSLLFDTLPAASGLKLYKNTHIKGLHAYIIKPPGAKKLIEKTYSEGVLPADIAVNSVWCNLYRTDTSLCQINLKYWSDKDRKFTYSYTKSEI
ncbi:MAG: hypothetical protein HN551_13685 [Tateyamaria sp.]|nr:hypothetical protein [Tateyamaria sp.]